MLVGKTLRNRYNILQPLGSGGFGDTYLAQDNDLPSHPKCVVKQLKPKDTSPQVLQIAKSLFEREAEYLYKLGGSQIPKLFAHFEENGEFFLVEEFVDGCSLDEEIRIGQKLSEAATIALLIEILEVLAFVHQQNVIHRDIKLTNLMRRYSDRKIVLIDFGAVKDVSALRTDSQGNTNVTVSIGSPGYMPNEQARGKPRLSSDVYAVGMIGIQALTGLDPSSLQEDANTGEVLWRDRVQISNTFAEILQKMVFYHFSQRYESAVEALQAMRSLTATNINHVNIAHPTGAPQVPSTIAHNTISAPSQSPLNLRPILWIVLIVLTSIFAAISTALLLPKLTNRQTDNYTSFNNSPKPKTSNTLSDPPISPNITNPDPTPPTEIPKPPIVPPNNVGSSFGAIAFAPSTRDKGYAWNFSTQKAAEARAISECESASSAGDCRVSIWVKNACMSIAEGTNGAMGSAWASDLTTVENKAKEVCQQYQGINCAITRTICVPVQ